MWVTTLTIVTLMVAARRARLRRVRGAQARHQPRRDARGAERRRRSVERDLEHARASLEELKSR